MDATMESKVKATVLDFVNRGFMFTAFDITKTLRNDGDRVRHGEINQLVQAMFANNELGLYARDLVNVGAPVEPFVYYHPYSDVTNYRSDWVEANPSQDGMRNSDGTDGSDGTTVLTATTTAPVSAPVAAPVAATAQTNPAPVTRSTQRVRIPTGENRLQIPVNLIRQVTAACNGQNSFGVVKAIDYASGSPKNMVVLAAGQGTDYTVNLDGRIRLSSSDVSYLNGSRQFDISLRGTNEIVVVPV